MADVEPASLEKLTQPNRISSSRKKHSRRVMSGLFAYLLLAGIYTGGFGSLFENVRSLVRGPLVSPLKWGNESFDYGLTCAVAAIWIGCNQAGICFRKLRRSRLRQPIKRLRDQLYGSIYLQHLMWPLGTAMLGALAITIGVLAWFVKWIRPNATHESNWVALALFLALVHAAFWLIVEFFIWAISLAHRQVAEMRGLPPLQLPKRGWRLYSVLLLTTLACAYLLVSQGVLATALVLAMHATFRQCVITRGCAWNWPRYVSLSMAACATAWGLSNGFSLLMPVLSSLGSQPMRTDELIHSTIAAAGLVTCAAHLLNLAPPVVPIVEFWRLPPKEQTDVRKIHLAWLSALLIGAVLATGGMIRWPKDSGFCLMAAMVLAATLRAADGASQANVAFCLIPRWTLWIVVVRQVGWQAVFPFLICEAIFLLPTIDASWRLWRRRNLPESFQEARRRSLRIRRSPSTIWALPVCQISVVLARSAPVRSWCGEALEISRG
jgi:hypothetical protein